MPATGYFNQNYYGIPSEADMRGQTPSSVPSYNEMVAANGAARATSVTTPGGQTFTTSDPNYSLNQYVQDTQTGNPFRKPGSVQDFATANGTPLSDTQLHDYTKRYNDYWDSQHPNLQGVGGWMHNHPVGTIAAFIAAAAGGSALSGYGLGGTGSGWGGGAVGGGASGGGSGIGGLGSDGGLGSTVGNAAGGSFQGGSLAGGGAAGGGVGGGAAAGGGGLGIFANGGTGGMAGVGGGNAGALANSGGISGGAGAGFLGSTGGSSGLSSLLGGNSSSLGGLMGGGGQQQPQQIPYSMPNLSGMLGSQTQPQQSSPTFVGLPNQSQMPFIPARGYTPHDFLGAKVWT